jgi:O-antigen/teichoic acid export membrane protein
MRGAKSRNRGEKTNNPMAMQGEARPYLLNSFWLLAEQALRMIAGFAVGIYVARYLGASQYGSLSYALAFVAVFAAMARLGLDGVVIRALVSDPARRELLLGTAFWLRVAAAVLAVMIVAGSISLIGAGGSIRLYVILIATGLVVQAFDVVDLDLQAKALSKYSALCRMAQAAISACVKLALVMAQAELVAFVAVALFDQLVLAAVFAVAYRRWGAFAFMRRFEARAARELLVSAAPLLLSGFMVAVYARIDQILVMEMLGARAVGIYAAAANLTEALYIVPTAVASAYFPALLAARQTSARYEARWSRLYKAVLVFGIASALAVSVGSGVIVRLLYGPDFEEAGPILAVQSWTLVFICYSAVFGKWLVAEGLHSILPRMTFVAMITNIAAILVLVPAVGLVGVALATLLTQLVPAALFFASDARLRAHLRRALLPGA